MSGLSHECEFRRDQRGGLSIFSSPLAISQHTTLVMSAIDEEGSASGDGNSGASNKQYIIDGLRTDLNNMR